TRAGNLYPGDDSGCLTVTRSPSPTSERYGTTSSYRRLLGAVLDDAGHGRLSARSRRCVRLLRARRVDSRRQLCTRDGDRRSSPQIDALTSIKLVRHFWPVNDLSPLGARPDPRRVAILELLRDGEQPVGALAGRLGVSQPAVSKHLRVLKNAGLVEARV